MKRMLKVILVISVVMFFIGCTGDDDPKVVAEKFLYAIKEGDLASFRKYATKKTREDIPSILMCSSKKNSDASLSKCFQHRFEEYTNFEAKSVKLEDNGKKAVVTLLQSSIDGTIQKKDIKLVKVNDIWNVEMNYVAGK